MKKYIMVCLLLLCSAANAGRVSAQSGVRYPYATVDAAGHTVIVCRDYKGGILPKYLLKPAIKGELLRGIIFSFSSEGVWLSEKFRVAKEDVAEANFDKNYCRMNYSEASDGSDKGSWRLPTLTELRLIAIMHFNNRINIGNIFEDGSSLYWTMTYEGSRSVIVCVGRSGRYETLTEYSNAKIRCVMDVQE